MKALILHLLAIFGTLVLSAPITITIPHPNAAVRAGKTHFRNWWNDAVNPPAQLPAIMPPSGEGLHGISARAASPAPAFPIEVWQPTLVRTTGHKDMDSTSNTNAKRAAEADDGLESDASDSSAASQDTAEANTLTPRWGKRPWTLYERKVIKDHGPYSHPVIGANDVLSPRQDGRPPAPKAESKYPPYKWGQGKPRYEDYDRVVAEAAVERDRLVAEAEKAWKAKNAPKRTKKMGEASGMWKREDDTTPDCVNCSQGLATLREILTAQHAGAVEAQLREMGREQCILSAEQCNALAASPSPPAPSTSSASRAATSATASAASTPDADADGEGWVEAGPCTNASHGLCPLVEQQEAQPQGQHGHHDTTDDAPKQIVRRRGPLLMMGAQNVVDAGDWVGVDGVAL